VVLSAARDAKGPDGHSLNGDIYICVNNLLTKGEGADVKAALEKTRYGSDLKQFDPTQGGKLQASTALRWPRSHIISQHAGSHFKRAVAFQAPEQENGDIEAEMDAE
jgi:hypothetical protein